MTRQHHPLAWERKPLLGLCRQHGLKIKLSLLQRPGAIEGFTTIQQGLNGSGITAGVLQQHHRPARCRQMPSQPPQMVGASTQPGHQGNPESIGTGDGWPPESQLQRSGAMRHRQAHRLDLQTVVDSWARQRSQLGSVLAEAGHQRLMPSQLSPPSGCGLRQGIQIQPQLLAWQRLQQIQGGNLGTSFEQALQSRQHHITADAISIDQTHHVADRI